MKTEQFKALVDDGPVAAKELLAVGRGTAVERLALSIAVRAGIITEDKAPEPAPAAPVKPENPA